MGLTTAAKVRAMPVSLRSVPPWAEDGAGRVFRVIMKWCSSRGPLSLVPGLGIFSVIQLTKGNHTHTLAIYIMKMWRYFTNNSVRGILMPAAAVFGTHVPSSRQYMWGTWQRLNWAEAPSPGLTGRRQVLTPPSAFYCRVFGSLLCPLIHCQLIHPPNDVLTPKKMKSFVLVWNIRPPKPEGWLRNREIIAARNLILEI